MRPERAYPVQRALALCGVWGRVLVASLTLACAMRGDRDSNLGPELKRKNKLFILTFVHSIECYLSIVK